MTYCSIHVAHLSLSCNEVGYFQEGAPKNWPSLVTRLVQPSYDEVCRHFRSRFLAIPLLAPYHVTFLYYVVGVGFHSGLRPTKSTAPM